MKLNYIVLKCANGEEFKIDGNHIGNTKIEGISESISRHPSDANEIDITPIAQSFAIEVKKEANQNYHYLNQDDLHDIPIDLFTCKTLFDRLTVVPDVVQISFCTYHSLSITQFKTIDLPTDMFNQKNNLEIASIGKSGNLYLRIAGSAEEIASDDLNELTSRQIELTLY